MPKVLSTHKHDAGFIAERENRYVPGTSVVAYHSAEQEIITDEPELKYTVVCDAHATCIDVYTKNMALHCCRWPDEFCDDCRELAETANQR